jgi:hypothetical protein
MSLMQQFSSLLSQYTGAHAQQPPPTAAQDFAQVAAGAPPDAVADGIAHAFRSDQTPPFPSMVGQLFGQSNPQQRAGLLNTIMTAAGPGILSHVMGGAFGGGQATPEQAAQVEPAQVQQVLAAAQPQHPGLLERVGQFYAQHPTLFQTLGAGTLTTVLSGMAQRHQAVQTGGPPQAPWPAPASQDAYGDPGNQQVQDASQDPYGDPANQPVQEASQDPYGDPADQQAADASQDPYGDPADQEAAAGRPG